MKPVILGEDNFFVVTITLIFTIITLGILVHGFLILVVGYNYYPNVMQGRYGTAYIWVFGVVLIFILFYTLFAAWL